MIIPTIWWHFPLLSKILQEIVSNDKPNLGPVLIILENQLNGHLVSFHWPTIWRILCERVYAGPIRRTTPSRGLHDAACLLNIVPAKEILKPKPVLHKPSITQLMIFRVTIFECELVRIIQCFGRETALDRLATLLSIEDTGMTKMLW